MNLLLSSCFSFVQIGWNKSLQEKALIGVQLITYTVIMVVFSSIFLITPFEELPGSIALNANIMIWYMVVTELVLISGGAHIFQNVRHEVLGGQFASSLQRPKSYFLIKIWTIAGENIIRLIAFLLSGILLGIYFTWLFPYSWIQLLFLLPSLYLGTIIAGAMFCALGLIEVWGPYARPAMWIVQKFLFLLGGLILPLRLYPEWVQFLAWLTPFPSILNIPAKIVFAPSSSEMALGLLVQVFWLCLIIGICLIVQHRAYQKLLRNGT